MGEKWRARRARRLRQTALILGSCLVLYCLFFLSRSPTDAASRSRPSTRTKSLPDELLKKLNLSEEQCNVAFPGLTKEIDRAVAEGPFTLKQAPGGGPVQGRIKDGQLYIIHAQRRVDLSAEMLNSRTAALHQLHRALITSPTPLPDTIFSLNFQDSPFGTAWSYSRPADQPPSPSTRAFLMPHFSFWSWPLPFIGSMWRASAAIARLESSLPFAKKTPKAVWRGTAWFNSVHNPQLRQNLLKAVKDKTWDWADVETLNWTGDSNATNALMIEDFCRYRYVVHTEGISYSGRFQFLQMCASVTVTTPIVWMQHLTHLVRPVFSYTLPAEKGGAGGGSRPKGKAGTGGEEKKGWTPSKSVRRAWPVEYPPEEANIVFVAPDWSDLEDTIAWMEDHPAVAEGIARRQRELFVGGGYFSPAAETCYWRALVRGWAKVVRPEEGEWNLGVPFEEFSLKNGD